MSAVPPWHLFQAFGVELEYMIVDAQTLAVRPITDQVLHSVAGEYLSEVDLGEVAWSNELALHVIELKTNGPASALAGLAELFQRNVWRLNELLRPLGARLMPTAMHPWMDPRAELRLWPHEHNPVYEAFDRIFDCRGHGWANLQSVHLNLPFADDEEFGRLHAAIRLLLPILPALAASSPVMEGRATGRQDNRLEVYRHNASRIPSLTGEVIPEPVFTRREYEREIFARMYNDIAAFDPAGRLQHEWLNSRGAIARFDRHAIEIRVLDVQECPLADLAIGEAIVAVLRELCRERWTSVAEQQSLPTAALRDLLLETIRDADQSVLADRTYLAQFGIPHGRRSAGELWRELLGGIYDRAGPAAISPPARKALDVILDQGPLSRRIERALERDMTRLPVVYGELCDCLAAGRMFRVETH